MGMLLDVLLISEEIKVKTEGGGEEKLIDAVKSTIKLYATECKKVSATKKSAMGPPHLRAWDKVLLWMDGAARQCGQNGEEVVAKIAAHTAEVQNIPDELKIHYLAEAVRYCRVSTTYKKTQTRMEVRALNTMHITTAAPVWDAIVKFACVHLQSERRSGKAPPGALQRQTVEKLKEMGVLTEGRPADEE
eukprot:TRINITY_DN18320_c0_g1_i1.p2 TRINITY_DN18320_c0_g1~~TRINITY_DN18320_c0_g1_i1.p2  ORF type:complete len:190 (-),score=54.89 TRINITY_DN18320_c0_g1_i1:406-975(-)